MLKKISAAILSAVMLLGSVAALASCDIGDILPSLGDNKDSGENETEKFDGKYMFEYTDIGNGDCIISNIKFNPDNNAPVTVKFPSASPEGKRVREIKFLNRNFILPDMMRAEDMEILFYTVEQNIEKAISEGRVSDAASARHKFMVLKSYYMRQSLADAPNIQALRDNLLKMYPVLAVSDSVYFLDRMSLGYEQAKILNNIITEYGITAEFVSAANKKLYDEVNNSNVENKAELLGIIPGYHIVDYPENVKEIVLEDLYTDAKHVFSAPNVEKLTVKGAADATSSVKVTLSALPSLKYVVADNVTVNVMDCPSIKQIDILGNNVSIYTETGTPALHAVIHESVSEIGSAMFSGGCAIDTVTIPTSVTSINERAFLGTNGSDIPLNAINYTGTEEQWNAIEKGNLRFPESVTINFNYTK